LHQALERIRPEIRLVYAAFVGSWFCFLFVRLSQPFQLVSRFIAAPERYINALFSELPFGEDSPES
jgi:hypothetical protein